MPGAEPVKITPMPGAEPVSLAEAGRRLLGYVTSRKTLDAMCGSAGGLGAIKLALILGMPAGWAFGVGATVAGLFGVRMGLHAIADKG